MGTETLPQQKQRQDNALAFVFILLLVDSLHFVFARLMVPYLDPYTSAFYVLGVATVQVGGYLLVRRQLQWSLLWKHWRFFAVIGFLVAFSTVLNYIAVGFVDAGTASLLGKSSIVFSVLLGLFWLKERLTTLQWAGTAVALIGVFIISFEPSSAEFGRAGALMVLGGSAMYATHAAVVKRYGGEMEFGNFFFFRILLTTLFLAVFAAGQGQLVVVREPRPLLLLILIGTVDVVISRILYYQALRRLNLSIHAIMLTMSPVIAIGWSLLLFGERPSSQGLVGGTAVIIGVILVNLVNARRRAKAQPTSP